MSCGMAKDAHEPGELTKPISLLQVIGDNDKSYHGSTNPKITMYSAAERIEIWRTFNQCRPEPVIEEQGDEIVWYTYSGPKGVEVVFGKVKDQEHHIRRDLRDATDVVAIDFYSGTSVRNDRQRLHESHFGSYKPSSDGRGNILTTRRLLPGIVDLTRWLSYESCRSFARPVRLHQNARALPIH